jgi:hypothetical protein
MTNSGAAEFSLEPSGPPGSCQFVVSTWDSGVKYYCAALQEGSPVECSATTSTCVMAFRLINGALESTEGTFKWYVDVLSSVLVVRKEQPDLVKLTVVRTNPREALVQVSLGVAVPAMFMQCSSGRCATRLMRQQNHHQLATTHAFPPSPRLTDRPHARPNQPRTHAPTHHHRHHHHDDDQWHTAQHRRHRWRWAARLCIHYCCRRMCAEGRVFTNTALPRAMRAGVVGGLAALALIAAAVFVINKRRQGGTPKPPSRAPCLLQSLCVPAPAPFQPSPLHARAAPPATHGCSLMPPPLPPLHSARQRGGWPAQQQVVCRIGARGLRRGAARHHGRQGVSGAD